MTGPDPLPTRAEGKVCVIGGGLAGLTAATLLKAEGKTVVGVVREVMTWPSYRLDELEKHGIPVISGFEPMPHTSRKGWLARADCYPSNPFATDASEARWPVRLNGRRTYWSLRRLARQLARRCGPGRTGPAGYRRGAG